MDRNFLLAFALSFLVLVVWTTWQAQQRQEMFPEGDATEPGLEAPPPTAPPAIQPLVPTAEPEQAEAAPELAVEQARTLELESQLYRAELTTRGGALLHWELARYHDASLPDRPRVELTTLRTGDVALATPLRELGQGDLSLAAFSVERRGPYELVFRRDAGGVRVEKTYVFDPDSYAFRLRIGLSNGSPQPIEPRFEVVWPAQVRELPDFADHSLVAFTEGSVERVPVASAGQPGFFSRAFGGRSETETVVYDGDVQWAGAQTRYFLSVLLPDQPDQALARFVPGVEGETADTVVGFDPVRLPRGQQLEREYRVYIGPKESDRLETVGASLDRSIDRGWAWVSPLTAAFSWLLRASYAIVRNYGLAIILITVLVRLVTAPLMSKQMRSMRRMGELQPKMKELQERYADDRQKQSEELMKLYRQSGVNPLGGCFPMLLQLPVFIGLYYALQSSIELRQQPFVLWIDDLSAPESLFVVPGLELPLRVLPLLMGLSMVLQQRLTPTTVDPAQARMMMTVMPVMFTVLFYQFPSGLVLYWLVSNLLGIAQQLWVNRGMRTAPAEGAKRERPASRQGRARAGKSRS